MPEVANFIAQNFRGPTAAQIDQDRYTNALLKQRVAAAPLEQERLSLQNQATRQDMSMAERAVTEQQIQTARGVLGRYLSAVSQSPQPVKAARALLGSKDFLAAGQLVGMPQFTITDQDTDELIAQQAADLARALGGDMTGSGSPAGVTEFEHLARGMSPSERQRAARIRLGLDSRAGQGRVTVINGVPTWTAIGDDGQPINVPLSTLQGEAGAAGTISQAEALGSGRGRNQAELEASAPQRAEKRRVVISTIDNVLGTLDQATSGVNWATVGAGALLRAVPGTPAFDLARALETVKANLGFDRLQQMRDASPTGGALGQVAVQELAALQSSIASLDQRQSGDRIKENLDRVREHYENWKRVVEQAAVSEGSGGGWGKVERVN